MKRESRAGTKCDNEWCESGEKTLKLEKPGSEFLQKVLFEKASPCELQGSLFT